MPRNSHKKYLDDLMETSPVDGRLRLELRKLSNSDGWISAPRGSSTNSSRASTPVSHSSSTAANNGTGAKRGRPRKHPITPVNPNAVKKKRGRPKLDKPKQFKMVLEKDDDFEVDYISPDDDEVSISEQDDKDATSMDSLSETDNFLDETEEDAISVEGFSSAFWSEEEEVIDESEIPKLELPSGSNDLLIPNSLVMSALAVYEVLRHFRNVLRLSPMLFEDFCAALVTTDTSIVLNECHIALLKALLKEEDNLNTTFSPPDQKDACSIAFYFNDYLTWPEVLCYYAQSSPDFRYILPIVEDKDFPYVSAAKKLQVLQFLINNYLCSTKIRDELMMDGTIHYDDHCRVCHRLGDLLCCETCPAVYHLACCNPPLKEVPDDEWQCEVCVAHKLNGVTNCESDREISGQYLRHEPIGQDRHGRKYWFLVRRLIVEDADKTLYYTTYEEFLYVRSKLDAEKFEMALCEALIDVEEDFPRQSGITEQLTNDNKWSEDAATCLSKLKDHVKAKIEEDRKEEEEKKKAAEAKKQAEQEAEMKRLREEEEKKAEELKSKTTEEESASKTPIKQENDREGEEKVKEEPMDVEAPEIKSENTNEENQDSQPDPNPSTDTKVASVEQEVAGKVETETALEEPKTEVKTESVTKVESQDTEDKAEVEKPIADVQEQAKSESETLKKSEKEGEADSETDPTKQEGEKVKTETTISQQSQSQEAKPLPTTPLTTKSTPILVKPNSSVPIKLANIKVPLSRCDSMVNAAGVSKPSVKVSGINILPKIQAKPSPVGIQAKPSPVGNVGQLRNLFVLGKDGMRTPITIGPGGRIITGAPQKILLLNSQSAGNKTPNSGPKVNRELRRLQFSSAGPKMQKLLSSTLQQKDQLLKDKVDAKSSVEVKHAIKIPSKPFRLGEDGGYKHYKNHHTENHLALNKYQHKEEKDRDRHVGYKFSVAGPVEFEWSGELCGTRGEIVHTLRSSLFRFEQQIPLCFMHSKWEQYRKMWGRMFLKNDSPRAFAVVLGILEMAIRTNVKKPVWKDSIGQSRMRRLTTGEKELYDKRKKHRVKAEEDAANRNAIWCKYPLPVRSIQVWKQKGEEYRITGYGGWMWLSSSFKSIPKPYKQKPFTVVRKSNPVAQDSVEKEQAVSKSVEAPTEPTKDSVENSEIAEDDSKMDTADSAGEAKTETKNGAVGNTSSDLKKEQKDFEEPQKKQDHSSEPSPKPAETPQTATQDDKTHDEDMNDVQPVEKSPLPADTATSYLDLAKEVDQLVARCDVIDISQNLLVRSVLYNLKWQPTKLDKMLRWRMLQEKDQNKSQNSTIAVPKDSTQSSTAKQNEPKPSESSEISDSETDSVASPKNNLDVPMTSTLKENKLDKSLSESNENTKKTVETNEADPSEKELDNKASSTTSKSADIQDATDISSTDKKTDNASESAPVPAVVCNGVDLPPESVSSENSIHKTTTVTTTTTRTETVVVNVRSDATVEQTLERKISTETSSTTTVETLTDTDVFSAKASTQVTNSNAKPVFTNTINTENKDQPEKAKVTVTSYDSSFKSSSVEVDPATDSMAMSVTRRQVSRRFRSLRRNGVIRHAEQSTVSLSSTSKSWKLKRSPADLSKKKAKEVKMPLPWKFSCGQGRRKNIFRLPSHYIRRLSRRGGIAWNPIGFHPTVKNPSGIELFWPYPCPRPTVGTVWRYKIQNATNLSSIAHLLRVLWHAIRWDDIITSPPTDDIVNVVNTDEFITTTELLKRREIDNSGLRSEFFVRRIQMPTADYEEDIPKSEAYTPSSRSGLRSRSRPMGLRERAKKENSNDPRVDTLWLPEEQIPLWQIRQFHTMLRTQQQKSGGTPLSGVSISTTTPPPTISSVSGAKIRITPHDRLSTPLTTKHLNVTPALLQQAAALHRTQIDPTGAQRNTDQLKRFVLRGNPSTPSQPEAFIRTSQGPMRTITIKSPQTGQQQIIALKPQGQSQATVVPVGNTIVQMSSGQNLLKPQFIVQGSKLIPGRQIIFKQSLQGSVATASPITSQKPSLVAAHPTIRLGGNSSSTTTTAIPVTPATPAPAHLQQPQQATPPGGKSSRMQVTLTTNQLSQLMKVGTETRVRVSIKLSDGRPGIGQLQVIPPGVQVNPAAGQQLMQCKVGNEVRKFLLTALAEKVPTPPTAIPPPIAPLSPPAANEVSVEAPSLKHRLLQLQHQRHQGLPRLPGTDVRQLLTDKDPLWGGRPTGSSEKVHLHERPAKKEMIEKPRRRQIHSRETREEQQRKAVIQQVMKSILDRIDRKEELDARRRRKEEHMELQKKKRESLDEQRLHHRLLHALRKHEDHLKHEIRKRRAISERYMTRLIENDLYEDQLRLGKKRPIASSTPLAETPKRKRKTSHTFTGADAPPSYGNVLAESNRRKSGSPRKQQQLSPVKSAEAVAAAAAAKRDASPNHDAVAAKKKKMISTSSKLYCVCKTPYDETKFYIGCDLCMNWFHGSCVGISEKKAKAMETWVCRDCANEQSAPQQELYCLCRTPYDDAQFYIGCDACQDWYHGSCVGISEEEASGIDSYTCPRCRENARDASQEGALSDRDYFNLTKIVRHLYGHKMAWPFLEPVREEDAPDYYRIVKRPMDLQTVLKRLECRYYMKLSELVGDVSLIFDNCRQYNGADSKIVKCAEIVETVFVGKIRDLRGRENHR